jgi:hypothetical protein
MSEGVPKRSRSVELALENHVEEVVWESDVDPFADRFQVSLPLSSCGKNGLIRGFF